MTKNFIFFNSTFFMFLCAYNPYTTYIFNKTGFYGAANHQALMILGWVIFVLLNAKKFTDALNFQNVIALFLILSFCSFSLINGVNTGTLLNSIADIAFLIEIWFFFIVAKIAIKYLSAEEFYKLLTYVFAINAIGLIVVYFFFYQELYYSVQLGPLRVIRNLDFLVVTGLILLIFSHKLGNHHPLIFLFMLFLASIANVLGFSRGVWLAIFIAFVVSITAKLTRIFVKMQIKPSFPLILLLSITLFSLITVQIKYSILDAFILRVLDFDYNSASIGGRIDSYFSLFTATFDNYYILLFGKGAGAFMPDMNIPASSSPSFLGSFLYTKGLVIFSIFIFFIVYVIYQLRIEYNKKRSVVVKFALYNILVHMIIINIFPAVSHYPILGFLTFTSIYAMRKGI